MAHLCYTWAYTRNDFISQSHQIREMNTLPLFLWFYDYSQVPDTSQVPTDRRMDKDKCDI